MASATEAVAATHLVSGKILEKETKAGVADLLVELFDLDAWADSEIKGADGQTARSATNVRPAIDKDIAGLYADADRIGSVITDAQGRFTFEIIPKDFNLPGRSEQKPDLVLVVLAPDEPGLTLDKRLLHVTRDIYQNAGRREAYVIRLPAALLRERQIDSGQPQTESEESGKARAALFVAAKARAAQFDREVAAAQAVEAKVERTARVAFRKSFSKTIRSDLAVTAPPGQVMADGDPDTIGQKNANATAAGVASLNLAIGADEATGVPVNLYFTPDELDRLGQPFAAPGGEAVLFDGATIDPLLFATNSSESLGTLLVHSNPIAAYCAAESFDETCARQHTGVPSIGDAGDHHEEQEDDETSSGSTVETISDEDLSGYLARLIRDMPSPDRVLQPELLAKRQGPEDLRTDVAKFSLPKGPAEMPAKYHFSSLQVAFEHVWKQLFDETIPDLAFTANQLGQSRYGATDFVNTALLNGGLHLGAFVTVTPSELPPTVAKHFDITKEDYNEMAFAMREELVKIAAEIDHRLGGPNKQGGMLGAWLGRDGPAAMDLRVVQRLTEQGDRLIDAVRNDNYHTLHKTLKELSDRLSGKYEFTVFAADKDYHSVNFGLLTTYEQEWTPLAIQPGRLVKTIPLAPKEERKYSVKTRRTEKRSIKEARKHNTAATYEQSSTGRMEAEIVAKAQTKTTFGLTAEGDYDMGVAAGKSTTTFGVEAVAESAQTRKDFREAVLKAAQEYKDEVSLEIASDAEFVVEGEDSGVISNTNDELAVSFLFYELQKRFRLSERLYRVQPVVLVAQEVPSPEKITPGWVLAHDWILRRVLLDDSFQPALDYFANKSVGDDFALREMRKNLRQQRSLVETLRNEFSAASVEADNRYSALARKIEDRIKEEEAEDTDGFFADVGDFFGGDGQSPEAAKARELAAKDAHQYALEKAEKVAAAMRQEISTLHSLTEAYNKTVQARLDNETRAKRLLVHIRNNILYYMQGIWSHEPPDQRYLRLHKVKVPVLELESRSYAVRVAPERDIFARFRTPGTEKHKGFLKGKLKHSAAGGFELVSLVEVCDLSSPKGYMGNYMVFPMTAHNALTEFMAAPYIDRAFGAMDPDEIGNINLDEFSKYVCCLHERLEEADFNALKPELKGWLEQILASPLRNGDEVVVPTGSLFIESLVDPNPILEDFKLKHRELDVFKVQEEVRRAGLENLRLAARLLHGERGDPDIEKKIVVQGGVDPTIDVDQP